MSENENPKRFLLWMSPADLLRWSALRFALAVPFALFFGFLAGAGPAGYLRGFQAALWFAFLISLTVKVNERFVVPKLFAKGEHPRGGRLLLHMSTFIVSSMGASFVAAIVVHFTVLPGFLGSTRSVIAFLLYGSIFCALFMGIAYAYNFQRAYLERIRDEEKLKARVEAELRTAAAIQRALLPGRRALPAYVEAAAAALPSRTIAGDFLDYFEIPGQRLAFVLGDVSGKGPPAAILAAALQGMFSSVAETEERPAGAIARVNRALVRREVESKFATVVHGLLDGDGRLLTCNAGHNPPLLLRAGGETEWMDQSDVVIGVLEVADFAETPSHLKPGDMLVLYSDGVTEAANAAGELFGDERLLAAVETARTRPPAEVVEHLIEAARTFVGDAPQSDDITVLVIRYRGNGSGLPAGIEGGADA